MSPAVDIELENAKSAMPGDSAESEVAAQSCDVKNKTQSTLHKFTGLAQHLKLKPGEKFPDTDRQLPMAPLARQRTVKGNNSTAASSASSSSGAKRARSRQSEVKIVRTSVKYAKEAVTKFGSEVYKVIECEGGCYIQCLPCDQKLNAKLTPLQHDGTVKHQKNVARFLADFNEGEKKRRQSGLRDKYAERDHDDRTKAIHKIVKVLLKHGVALSIVEDKEFRDVLHKPPGKLPISSRPYRDEIPSILLDMQLKSENFLRYRKKNVSIYFDGTTNIAQVMAVVAFYFDDEFNMHREVLRLDHRAGHDDGVTLYNYLKNLIQSTLNISPQNVVAFGHDRCPTNRKAARFLCGRDEEGREGPFYGSFDGNCLSHGLALVGQTYLKLEIRDAFINALNAVFSYSPNGFGAITWERLIGSRWPGKGMIRWFSHHDLCKYFFENYNDTAFREWMKAMEDENFCPNQMIRVKETYQSQQTTLFVQLAAGVDFGVPLYRACYDLERDGANSHLAYDIVVKAYDELSSLQSGAKDAPNLNAIARTCRTAMRSEESLKSEAYSYAAMAKNYFKEQFFQEGGGYYNDMCYFKAAKLVIPQHITTLADENVKDIVKSFCQLTEDEREDLFSELKEYREIAKTARRVDSANDLHKFWKENLVTLPCWCTVAKIVMLTQTSSASCERVFALLLRNFGTEKKKILQDARLLSCKINQDKVVLPQEEFF